jgi:hypothetical protein
MSQPAPDLARWRVGRRDHAGSVDLAAAEAAASDLLTALGIDADDESTAATPGRMARAFAEMLTPPEFEMTTFPNDEGYDELVLVQDIPVQSLCEHHMLPFVGVAHVGTCRPSGSSACPSWPGPWSTTRGTRRPRSGSRSGSPTIFGIVWPRRAWVSSSRPSTPA